MASEKKASEGIALLSMYGDEDDEMEELDEEVENIHEEKAPLPASDAVAVAVNDSDGISDYGNEYMQRQQEDRGLDDNYTPNKGVSYGTPPASATPQQTLFFGSDLNNVQIQKSRLTIVDYGHEEGAMSPEAEEGEIMATGRVMYGEQLLSSDGESREKKSPGMARLPTPSTQGTTPQSLEQADQPESVAVNYAANESEVAGTEDTVMVSADEHKKVDTLDSFLPPPPKARCSEDLQEKITRFLALKKTTGRSFNAEVRNRKEYRNPDFLLHAVTYQDIDQIGSCFRKDVFDPHGYDKSDFCDELVDMRREMERREHERKKNQKLEFTPGAVQPGNVLPTSKINIPTPGLAAVSSGVLNLPPASSDAMARDGRQNKKSKWDKMWIKGVLWPLEGKKIFLLLVLMQHSYLPLKLAVDTLHLRNKGERRQKIGDLAIGSPIEDSKAALTISLNIHIRIAADDMKTNGAAMVEMSSTVGHLQSSITQRHSKVNPHIVKWLMICCCLNQKYLA